MEKKFRTPEEEHQHQTWLEIWLPFIIGLAVCAALVVLIITAAANGDSSIAQWSAISLILMIFPALFLCLIMIALIIFIDYWVIKGNRGLPAYSKIIREKVNTITGKIQSILLSIMHIISIS